MAITSIGYQGQMTTAEWSKIAQVLGHSYTAIGADSFKVSPTTGDRTVLVRAGKLSGRGVLDTLDANTTAQFATVSSGTRYDMLVLRRTWGSPGTSTLAIIQGTATRALPARNISPGVLDDQPIALVRLVAGQTAVQEVIDLRVWNADGGCWAYSDFFTNYMTDIGTQVRVGNDLWTRVINSTSGAPAWERRRLSDSPLEYIGTTTTGVLAGAWGADPARNVKFQGGTFAARSDSSGFVRLEFPTVFPTGLITIWFQNGDSGAHAGIDFEVAGAAGPPPVGWGSGTKDSIVYRVMSGATGMGNFLHRCNWGAFGW